MNITIVSATWCGPCKMLQSFIKDWDKTNIRTIYMKDLTDEERTKYNPRGVPSVYLENEEEIVDKFTGLNIRKLEEFKERL